MSLEKLFLIADPWLDFAVMVPEVLRKQLQILCEKYAASRSIPLAGSVHCLLFFIPICHRPGMGAT